MRVLSYEISQMLSAMAGVQDAEDKVDIEFILMTFWLNRGQETSVPIKKIVQDIQWNLIKAIVSSDGLA